MKTIRMLFTVALLLGAASIYTQAESQTLLAVSIPFGFTVKDQSFLQGTTRSLTHSSIQRLSFSFGAQTASTLR